MYGAKNIEEKNPKIKETVSTSLSKLNDSTLELVDVYTISTEHQSNTGSIVVNILHHLDVLIGYINIKLRPQAHCK